MTKFFNIKSFFKYSALLLCAIIISCKSPTQPVQPIVDIQPDNTPPVVTFISYLSWDTLKITIHAADPTLSNGYLDFKDGTIITFSHLHLIIDTIITHVYSQTGQYFVTAMFSDGKNSTRDSASVIVKHYLALSFDIGMTWRFSYNYDNSDNVAGTDNSQKGTHIWKIISSEVNNSNTVFSVMHIINDVIRKTKVSPNAFDSSYAFNDTSYFTITYSYSQVQWNWPTKMGVQTSSIPNHIFINSYPLSINNSIFDDNGPYSFSYWFGAGAWASVSENFTLIDFTKP